MMNTQPLSTLSLVELSSEVEDRFTHWIEHTESKEAYEHYMEAQQTLLTKIKHLSQERI